MIKPFHFIYTTALIFLIQVTGCKNNSQHQVDSEMEKKLQEKFVNAREGEVIDPKVLFI